MAYKQFTNGDVLNASEINDNLMNQSVMVFFDDSSRTAAIPSPIVGMVTYLQFDNTYYSWTGSAWVATIRPGGWVAFTPTWSALTVGNGVYLRSHFARMGKTVTVAIVFQLGSTSAVTGNITLTLPTTLARADQESTGLAQLLLADISAQSFLGVPVPRETNSRDWLIRAASGSPVISGATSATAPFTWATGDKIIFGATYEAV